MKEEMRPRKIFKIRKTFDDQLEAYVETLEDSTYEAGEFVDGFLSFHLRQINYENRDEVLARLEERGLISGGEIHLGDA